jgi:hypothetical protein
LEIRDLETRGSRREDAPHHERNENDKFVRLRIISDKKPGTTIYIFKCINCIVVKKDSEMVILRLIRIFKVTKGFPVIIIYEKQISL